MSIPVNIFIQSKDLADLIVFYEAKLKEVKQQRKDLEVYEREIRHTIMQLKAKHQETESINEKPILFTVNPNKNAYNRNGTWVEKIEFAIREAARPLNTTEIVDLLIVHEPILEDNKKRSVASVSSILSLNSGAKDDLEKKFVKIEDATGRTKFFVKDDFELEKEPVKSTEIEPSKPPIEDLPF
jgi:hypothetical protein